MIIVDTSNEIAGDGDIPHPAIGKARRMQVASPALQHAVMIEAVENHMPEVIVIDEIGTELEAGAARTIAERGVQLVATAHGNELQNLMMNPTLSDLIGGIQSVTLSDEEARRRNTQKSILERRAPPTFDVLIEIQSWNRVAIHGDVASTVDSLSYAWLQGDARRSARSTKKETSRPSRLLSKLRRSARNSVQRNALSHRAESLSHGASAERSTPSASQGDDWSRPCVRPACRRRSPNTLPDADVVITLRNYYRRKLPALQEAEARGVPIYVLRANTVAQIEQCLLSLQPPPKNSDPVTSALEEAEVAAADIAKGDREAELAPQNAYIRRLQHELAQRYNLSSRSLGREPKASRAPLPRRGCAVQPRIMIRNGLRTARALHHA